MNPDGAGSSSNALAALYQRLPVESAYRHIRLVELLPGDWASNICCRLFLASLDDRATYRILSYADVSAAARVDVTINEVTVSISPSLATVLRRLRKPNHEEPVLLWVEDICINQGDVAERTAQAVLKPRILYQAVDLFAWLGDYESKRNSQTPICLFSRRDPDALGDLFHNYAQDFRDRGADIDYAFHVVCVLLTLKDIQDESKDRGDMNLQRFPLPPQWGVFGYWMTKRMRQRYIDWFGQPSASSLCPPSGMELDSGAVTRYVDKFYDAWGAMSLSPWFLRLNSVLEYALARSVTFGFGSAAICVRDMVDAVSWARAQKDGVWIPNAGSSKRLRDSLILLSSSLGKLQSAREAVRHLRPRLPASARVFTAPVRPVISQVRRYAMSHSRTTLFDLCAEAREFCAADEQLDQVFVPAMFMKYLGIDAGVEVDYAAEPAAVYEAVSAQYFARARSRKSAEKDRFEPLAPLRLAKPGSRIGGMPSWVVDWTQDTGSGFVWRLIDSKQEYGADEGMVGVPPYLDGRVLKVSGIEVDTVYHVQSLLSGRIAWAILQNWASDTTDLPQCVYAAARERRHALLRTLCADNMPDSKNGQKWDWWVKNWDVFKAWMERAISRLPTTASMMDVAIAAGRTMDLNKPLRPGHPCYVNIFTSIAKYVKMGQVFRCASGRFGITAADVKPMQKVFVLDGGRVPFLLSITDGQPDGDDAHYKLVGDCFLDTMMYGAAANLACPPEPVYIH